MGPLRSVVGWAVKTGIAALPTYWGMGLKPPVEVRPLWKPAKCATVLRAILS